MITLRDIRLMISTMKDKSWFTGKGGFSVSLVSSACCFFYTSFYMYLPGWYDYDDHDD